MIKLFQKQKKEKGFTLIEMIVASFVFLLVIIVVISVLISTIRSQNLVLEDQKVLAELSYAMEYMSRALRMAKSDDTGNCSPHGIYSKIDNRIKFLNYEGKCQHFYLEEGTIKTRIEETNLTSGINLTSDKINIENFLIELKLFREIGMITINIQAKAKSEDKDKSIKTNLQTTVSRRYY